MRHARVLQTIDCHAAGEPLRIITGGLPPIPGETMLARRRYMLDHLDHTRRLLMWEPRGHRDMYGCVITPPVTAGAQAGVLFMHNEGYSTMCGHGVIGLVTVLLETGQIPAVAPETRVTLDTPAGVVQARARVEAGRVRDVTMANVPSFAYAIRQVAVPGRGEIVATVAYGGAFYVLVDAPAAGLGASPGPLPSLVAASAAIKSAVGAAIDVAHPQEPEIQGLYGVVLSWPGQHPGANRTSLTVFADNAVDRSPCGTCTSALMAALWSAGGLDLGEPFVNESLVGTRFSGRLLSETSVGPYPAAMPEVTGSAAITGFHTFVLDEDDPLPEGFLLR
ncbi:MAG TPA: proline racemase family protein [bacterium]|nr:proline racemase family protein [bacterium]